MEALLDAIRAEYGDFRQFASFNKAFDFNKYQETSWPENLVSNSETTDKECKEEKIAPIAKLESLDELDLESPPLGSPKCIKK